MSNDVANAKFGTTISIRSYRKSRNIDVVTKGGSPTPVVQLYGRNEGIANAVEPVGTARLNGDALPRLGIQMKSQSATPEGFDTHVL